MLHINSLIFRFGGRILFNDATAHIPAGQKVGLVGRNGSGKSTLFKLILGELGADGGSISCRPRARIGAVGQDIPEGQISLLDCVLSADQERVELLAQAESCHDGLKLGEIHERLNAIDAHSAPSRAGTILSGLGFDAEAQSRPVDEFSGGWRMRVALAKALFARPDLLLLDEPTNHLDLEATLWLQDFLASYPGTLLIISHDREILNQVCERIIHLDQGRLISYGGNYDRFEQTRRAKLDLAAKAMTKQLEQRRKIQAFIDRFRAKATKAAQAQSRIKMLERMGPVAAIVEDKEICFDFPDPEILPPPVIALENAVCGYDGKAILKNVNLRVDMEDRIALLGANGNGKSTLAKVLARRLALISGESRASSKLKIGYFAQHQSDELDLKATPYDHMAKLMPMAPESKIRAQLGRFGFEQERADVTVGLLSGGEKARLLFALMSRDAPHLMILDEPTNHLDIDSREALIQALNAYDGAVILISHDPHLIEMTADRLILVADGGCKAFDGDLNDYRAYLLDLARSARREIKEAATANSATANTNRKEERRNAALDRARVAPLKKRVTDSEKRLETLSQEKSRLLAKLADPKLYDGKNTTLITLQTSLADIEKTIATTEEEWLLALDELEAMG